jgi:histone H3/H4
LLGIIIKPDLIVIRKIQRDTIRGITKGDLRRLARRGGVKRMSAMVYDDMRTAIKERLEIILKDVVALVGEYCCSIATAVDTARADKTQSYLNVRRSLSAM